MIITRPATQTDLPRLYELWQEQSDIESQLDPRLAPFQRELAVVSVDLKRSIAVLEKGIHPQTDTVIVAERDDVTVGFIHADWHLWGEDKPPVGQILHIVVDAHRGQGGVGTALLDAVLIWFRQYGVRAYSVQVPRYAAVQQAFWRAKGGSVLKETMVLSIADEA